MTIEDAKILKQGDRIIHNGYWAYRVSEPRVYTVIRPFDGLYIRLQDDRGYASIYSFGAGPFVAEDFFSQCFVFRQPLPKFSTVDFTCPCGMYVHPSRHTANQIHISDCPYR